MDLMQLLWSTSDFLLFSHGGPHLLPILAIPQALVHSVRKSLFIASDRPFSLNTGLYNVPNSFKFQGSRYSVLGITLYTSICFCDYPQVHKSHHSFNGTSSDVDWLQVNIFSVHPITGGLFLGTLAVVPHLDVTYASA